MSYCRFSSNNFDCDLYCYPSDEGYVTCVAASRVVGEVPKIPELDVAIENIDAYVEAAQKQSEFMKTAERAPIGLPHDGATFIDPDLESFLARVKHLVEVGYHVPPGLIPMIESELEEEADGR